MQKQLFTPLQEGQVDKLAYRIYKTREEMGKAAAEDVVAAILEELSHKDKINMIFAAAPSQNEVLMALVSDTRIDWSRIRAFHMDEYIGLPASAPQGFANFLRNALFDKVHPGELYCISSETEAQEEAKRYTALLKKYPPDIVVLGIGENGHIAFNDPHVAFFNDPFLCKPVELDGRCRMQQVHDGCFASLDLVPKTALTLTIPALACARHHFCVVPAASKAEAVERTLTGPIEEACPATILRTLPHAVLYCDAASGQRILG